MFQGPLACEQRELVVTAGNDVGFNHSLNWITGEDGQDRNRRLDSCERVLSKD